MRKGTRERKEKKTKKRPRRNEGNDDDDDDDKKKRVREREETKDGHPWRMRRAAGRRKKETARSYDGEGFARRRRITGRAN